LRVAFYFDDAWNGNYARPPEAGSVWVMTLDGSQMTELPGVWANSIDWAPDGSRLAIASGNDPATFPPVGGPILIYSVATKELSPLPDATDATAVAWSPDGGRIAYQRVRTPGTLVGEGIVAGTDTQEIWTIGADGRGRTLQTHPFAVNHGGGPEWSPAGDRIAYMRVCPKNPANGGPCRERHDVVLLTPGTTVDETDPVGSEVVLPLARADTGRGPAVWFPDAISWSPDGEELLYIAGTESVSELYPSRNSILVVDVDGSSPPFLREVPMQSGSWGRWPGR
jgi:Tol biopolymer transport system component